MFKTPLAHINLQCSDKKNAQDQGWNQADHYLITQLQNIDDYANKKIGCINDSFGALSLSLEASECYTDSAVSQRWISHNAKLNNQAPPTIHNITELAQADCDIYLVRLPKNLHYFQYLLSLLSQKTNATVIIAGMQKHWPASFYQTADNFFDHVTVLPGVKKAKCMILTQGKAIKNFQATVELTFPDFNLKCCNHPNVFAREKLDIGTRFILQHLPDLSACKTIVDLACGNGLLGIAALKKHPHLHCLFIDESGFAIQSAADSLALNKIDENRYTLEQADVFNALDYASVDAILCNPPFHQQHNVSIDIAEQMIVQGARRLKKGGHMIIIANSHLPYKPLLKRVFSSVSIANKNAKFLLYDAVK